MSRIPTGGNFSPGIDHDNYSYAYFVYSDGDVYVDNGSWGVMGSYGRSSPDLAVYGYDVYYDGDVKYGSGVYLGGNSKKKRSPGTEDFWASPMWTDGDVRGNDFYGKVTYSDGNIFFYIRIIKDINFIHLNRRRLL